MNRNTMEQEKRLSPLVTHEKFSRLSGSFYHEIYFCSAYHNIFSFIYMNGSKWSGKAIGVPRLPYVK